MIAALKTEEHTVCTVLRDGVQRTVSTNQLVPGDLVVLEPGDKVPADIRLLEDWGLEVNEAMLTGESAPVVKQAGQLPAQTPLAERSNLLFMGTNVTRGRGYGLVVGTGNATEMGRLNALLNEHQDEQTFLQAKVAQVSKRFVLGAFVAAGAVAVAGLMRQMPPAQLLISSVTLAASAIPEGLPLTITVALTTGILHMSKRRAAVKKLASLESLGRVTVICSDKTGTLTKNEMTVKEISTVAGKAEVLNGGQMPKADPHFANEAQQPFARAVDDADIRQLLMVGMLCNNACSNPDSTAQGDPTEVAVLSLGRLANMDANSWKRHREIPFDSATRSMSVVCEENEQTRVVCEDEAKLLNRCTVFTKGAPEEVLSKCTHYLLNGIPYPMTRQIQQEIRDENFRLANQALRVLAFAFRDLDEGEDPAEATDDNLVYVGMMGMMDPPKEGVADSIAQAKRLGIKPVMITGDHPVTARAVAMELGIFQPGDRIMTGEDLDDLPQQELDRLISGTSIFARVSPEHKLRIVQAYRRIGEVVAMTGDGVNDAPALKSADVGIAMGLKGSDVAKGSAGIVLMEDHFQSILDGVKAGRSIIANIRKAMGCLLAGNLAEVLVTAISIVIGLPMPLIPLQILLMNILTDAVPAMVLATGPQEEVQIRPYRDILDKDLYRAVLVRGGVLGLGAVLVFGAALAMGVSLPLAQTMTYASLIVTQLMMLPHWRKYGDATKALNLRRDRVLLTASIGSLLALGATIYIPGIQRLFATQPLGVQHWGIVLLATSGMTQLSNLWIRRTRDGRGRLNGLPVRLSAAAA